MSWMCYSQESHLTVSVRARSLQAGVVWMVFHHCEIDIGIFAVLLGWLAAKRLNPDGVVFLVREEVPDRQYVSLHRPQRW